MLWRNLIRLLLTFLAVALVTWLLVWHNQRRDGDLIYDCGVKGADGEFHLGPCEYTRAIGPGS